MAGSQTPVGPLEIRQLFELEQFDEIFQLQRTIWSYADRELIPMRFLAVAAKVGGHVFGAYDGPRMIGFCFAIPGIKPGGRPYLHSHMLGVLPDYRNAQIGRRLKLRQRDDALARGIPLIEWTFDPLELKNAFLNIEKLGAIVRVYKENLYGATTSPLHGDLPTDRCIAEWWLDSPRVRGILSGGGTTRSKDQPDLATPQVGQADPEGTPPANQRPDQELAGESACPTSLSWSFAGGTPIPTGQKACPAECIAYPADIARLRASDPPKAREIQQTNARLFLSAFERGMAVTGFARSATEGAYLLEPWP